MENNLVDDNLTSLPTLTDIDPVQLTAYQNKSWLDWLELFAQLGMIRQLDFQLAKFLSQQEQHANPQAIAVVVAAVSYELSRGHTCLRLDNHWHPLKLFGASQFKALFNDDLLSIDFLSEVNQSSLIAQQSTVAIRQPLVYEFGSLYLQKYWHFEQTLAKMLTDLSQPVHIDADKLVNLRAQLDRLFAWPTGFLYTQLQALKQNSASQIEVQRAICESLDIVHADGIDWEAVISIAYQAKTAVDLEKLHDIIPLSACLNHQKVAAATALTQRFCVISGGPGTGKTTTVSKLLAALVSSFNTPLAIKLAAPTGKAAARLTESIGNAIDSLPIAPDIKEKIPTSASTIHRLLGAIPNRTDFKHNAKNPLHLDLLILDEASMVDLPMMFKLLDALPTHARLILLGDRDQLSSVEAGAVLGDICQLGRYGYSQMHSELVGKLTGYKLADINPSPSSISDSLCVLQKSYRFHSRSGIGKLALSINRGDFDQVVGAFAADYSDIEQHELDTDSYAHLIQSVCQQYTQYLDLHFDKAGEQTMSQYALSVLQSFAKTRLLCAVREGEFGIEGLNHRIEQSLASAKKIPTDRDTWYLGRPVMVTTNDHGQQLYNGDIGICLLDESLSEPRLKVYFEQPDGTVKGVLPSRVPPHETAYAMTIHKSQGSEFDYTLLVLPKIATPVLTRELFYTGVTRAKNRLAVFADKAIMQRAVNQKTARQSHLGERISRGE